MFRSLPLRLIQSTSSPREDIDIVVIISAHQILNRHGSHTAAKIARGANFGFHLGFWPPGNRLLKNRQGWINFVQVCRSPIRIT